jgi:hypothetical protein
MPSSPAVFTHPYDSDLDLRFLRHDTLAHELNEMQALLDPAGLTGWVESYLDAVLAQADPNGPLLPRVAAISADETHVFTCNYKLGFPGAEAAFAGHHLPGLAYLGEFEALAVMLPRGEADHEAMACLLLFGDGQMTGLLVPLTRHAEGIRTAAAFPMREIPKKDLQLVKEARVAIQAISQLHDRQRTAAGYWDTQD